MYLDRYKLIVKSHKRDLDDITRPNCDGTYDKNEGIREMRVYHKLIIEACEKQIGKKPNKFDGYQCVLCNKRLARQTDLINQAYCHHCGQKQKWGEEE